LQTLFTPAATRASGSARVSLHPWWAWWWRDPFALLGIAALILLVIACALVPWLPLPDPAAIDLSRMLSGPLPGAPLGTDQLGRDLLSRMLWAGRTSLMIAVLVLLISLTIGLAVGTLAGYTGGLIERLLMSLVDATLALPTLILTAAVLGMVGPSPAALVVVLVAVWWPHYARLVRSRVVAVQVSGYIEAAEALGCRFGHIVRQHVLPGIVGQLLVQLSLDAGAVVLTLGSLSFVGLGVQPPDPEWGAMLIDARPLLDGAPLPALVPGVALLVTIFGCNALGAVAERWLRAER
jgi:ABC-type dipeptide/oligopeptide/nickel transport system permease subunit